MPQMRSQLCSELREAALLLAAMRNALGSIEAPRKAEADLETGEPAAV
jgi:hypothetical protein